MLCYAMLYYTILYHTLIRDPLIRDPQIISLLTLIKAISSLIDYHMSSLSLTKWGSLSFPMNIYHSGAMIRGHSKRGRSKSSKVKHLRATVQLLRFNRCKLITMALQQLKYCETSTQT